MFDELNDDELCKELISIRIKKNQIEEEEEMIKQTLIKRGTFHVFTDAGVKILATHKTTISLLKTVEIAEIKSLYPGLVETKEIVDVNGLHDVAKGKYTTQKVTNYIKIEGLK